MPTKAPPKRTISNTSFEDHVRTSLYAVRGMLADMLGTVGADPSQPRSMAKRLGLDKTLAWKLSRIVSDDNLAAMVDHLPGRAGMDIALRALESLGASDYSLSALRHALAEFDRTVELHCGDRATLELMLEYMHPDQREREEANRLKAFEGNRAIWGVQARVQLCMQFVAPNASDPALLDFATVSGLLDLRRLRHDTVWPMASFRQYSDDGSALPPQHVEPIDPRFKLSDGPPLLLDFCSNPLPALRAAPGLAGTVIYEIVEGPIGNTAAATCLAGRFSRARASAYRDERERFGEFLVSLNTPAEILLHDLYVHRSMTAALSPEAAIYSQLPSEPMYPAGGRERGRLKFSDKMIDLGDAPRMVVTPEMPRYAALADFVFTRLGWNVEDFHGFRFRMRYPPMPSRALFRYELPERPRPRGPR